MAAALKAAISDGVITFLWIFCVSSLRAATTAVASAIGVEGQLPSLFVTVFLITLLLFVFNLICDAAGGASFNPIGTVAFYAAGFGKDGLFSLALRFPAQALGAAGGALAILECMPEQYKHMLSGPSLKVDLHTGAIAEGILTFVITLAVLLIVIKGPKNRIVKSWLLAVSTVSLVLSGAGYTGPAMNPANAFAWAYINDRHDTFEHFYVYWICPFVGAILAAVLFKAVLPSPPPPPPKAKKA